jgi:hypothetical protein
VRRTADETLFNGLTEEHHYLGYEQPAGEHLKYLGWAQGRPIACLAWSSAPRHIGSRDRYIGWSAEARRGRHDPGGAVAFSQIARLRRPEAVIGIEQFQQHSKPILDNLHVWLEAQCAERNVEPNSSLGKAITYLLRHWKALTLFLREAGAPLDNSRTGPGSRSMI